MIMIDCKYLGLVVLIRVQITYNSLFDIPSGPTALCVDNLCKSDETSSKETSKSGGTMLAGVWAGIKG